MKFLIADDHSIFRTGLRPVLEQLEPGVEILEAENFSAALAAVRENADIDVILLDLLMPGMSAFQGLEAIRAAAPDIPVVVVSMIERRQDVLRSIELGALGYVPKTTAPAEFVRALRQVMNGDIYLPSTLMSKPQEDIVPSPQAYAPDSDAAERLSMLTRRQRDVVALLGQGMTNAEIAAELGLSESTVRLHVSTILDRLGLNNRTQVALLAVHVDTSGDSGGRRRSRKS